MSTRKTMALSPWAQDQRRIRRLRTKVKSACDSRDVWMKNSLVGWGIARTLLKHIRDSSSAIPEEIARWELFFEHNEPL
jgi:hypothetical protein